MSLCPAWVRIFQVTFVSFPGEGVGESGPGSMEADGGRVRRDPEDRRDLLVPQLLPRDEAQELLVGGRKGGKGDEGRPVAVIAGAHRGRDVLDAQERRESIPPAGAPSMVGEDPSGDGVEPWKRLPGRDALDLAPGDGEGLGRHILGVGKRLGTAHGVGEDVPLVLREERVEAGER